MFDITVKFDCYYKGNMFVQWNNQYTAGVFTFITVLCI